MTSSIATAPYQTFGPKLIVVRTTVPRILAPGLPLQRLIGLR